MRKFLVVFLVTSIALFSAFFVGGCGCNKTGENAGISTSPKTDIVGDWGGRSDDVEVSFKDDGSCSIGNIKGTYKIDDNDTITVTPLSDDKQTSSNTDGSMTFTYYSAENGNISDIPKNSWTISGEKLYINGYQYEKENTNTDSSNNSSASSNVKNESSNSSSSSSASKPNDANSSSSNSGSSNSSSSNSSSSNSGSSSSSSSNSSSSSSSSSNSNSSKPNVVEVETIPTQPDEDLENPIVTIYENLDDFD